MPQAAAARHNRPRGAGSGSGSDTGSDTGSYTGSDSDTGSDSGSGSAASPSPPVQLAPAVVSVAPPPAPPVALSPRDALVARIVEAHRTLSDLTGRVVEVRAQNGALAREEATLGLYLRNLREKPV